MGKKALSEIESLARNILTTYFCDSDMEFLISTFADDIIWLGGGEHQKAEGKEAVTAVFRCGKDDMIACSMYDEQYHSIDLGGGSYLCEAVSRLSSKPESETYLNTQQRATFIFREKGDGLETVHIHSSIPFSEIHGDELFPVESGRSAFERLQSALEIKKQEYEHQTHFLEQLYHTLPCGILQFSTDPSHTIILINPMVWKFYGYTSETEYREAVRNPLQKVDTQDLDWVTALIDRLSLNGESASYRRHCIKKDGEEAWINVVMGRILNNNGMEVIQAVFTDITEQMRLEQAQEQLLRDALAAAQAASRAKSDFLSRMSHDIRTPMNAVIGMSTIGQIKLNDPKTVKDCFQKIDTSYKYLLSLINDILDMSRIETDKMEIAHDHFDFSAFVEEINQIIYPQTEEREIAYEMRHREPLESHYIGDSLRMKRILMNLLSNALKFTQPGGSVCVEIAEEKRTNGYAYIQFVIEDNGIGMSEEFMKRIFQPFEQESPGNARNNVGSGLGLSIVYSLVQLMGGSISVTSRKQEGSRFTVTIPFQLVTDNAEKEWERKRQNLLKGFQVLVVDDDPAVGRQTALILDDIGADTRWVDAGIHAVREVEHAIAENWMFDIAMIDWKMPGMDGIETARRIRRLVGPDTMIIMITAYDWHGIEEEAREAGIDYFIAKPLFRSVIYDTLLKLDKKEIPEPSEPYLQTQESVLAGSRILLVEDNELNQEIAKTLLEMNGAEVDVAENGMAAIDCFCSHAAGTYQAILMDIRMPVMDGLDAARGIRTLGRDDSASIPILAMTANAFEEDRRKAFEASMNGYLIKPLDVNALVRELEKAIRG